MRQEYHIEGQTTQQIVSKWNDHQITEGKHLVCSGVCLDKYLLVEDLIKLLEVSILDVEEAQGNEFDRGYATALSVLQDWIVDNASIERAIIRSQNKGKTIPQIYDLNTWRKKC